jgi:hypothetical protein
MQLPPTDEIVMTSGVHPIRAKKARYYEDGRFQERIVAPPIPARPKAGRPDDWSSLPLPPPPSAPAGTDGEDTDDENPKNTGRRKQPELCQGIVEKQAPIENEFALDQVDDREEDAPRIGRINDLMQGLAQQPSLDPGEAGRDFTLGMQALKRVAQPDDIAGAIAFLASDAARWVSATRCGWMAAPSSDCTPIFNRRPRAQHQDPRSRPSDHHRAEPRPRGRHLGRARDRGQPRDANPARGELSARAVHPAQGCGHGGTRSLRHHDLLPIQGRRRVFQHSGRRQALGRCDLDLRGALRPLAEIKDHLAFYPDRIDAIEQRDA